MGNGEWEEGKRGKEAVPPEGSRLEKRTVEDLSYLGETEPRKRPVGDRSHLRAPEVVRPP